MDFIFRRATTDDLEAVMGIIAEAQAFLAEQGVDQWQDGYPQQAVIAADMEAGNSYVLCAAGQVVGTIAVCYGKDPSYEAMREGEWAHAGPYAALHRIAVSSSHRGAGTSAQLMGQAQRLVQKAGLASIRIDTHRHNKPMQRFLRKQGFVHRGIVYLPDGAERFAFEKSLAAVLF